MPVKPDEQVAADAVEHKAPDVHENAGTAEKALSQVHKYLKEKHADLSPVPGDEHVSAARSVIAAAANLIETEINNISHRKAE